MSKLRSILFLILLISLLVRVYNIDYPISYIFAWGDGTRDYYVADHIVKYGEIPLLGPYNLLYEIGIYNTPVYFYLLSLFLLIYNSVLTLAVVNIFIQIFGIFLIYLIAKKIFDEKVAILSAILFSFNPEILAQSDYIWQPHISTPFAYLALLLMIYFYFNRTLKYLLASAISLAFSFSMHNSSVPWIPLFLLTSLLLLRKNWLAYTSLLAIFFSFLILLYIPVGIFITQSSLSTSPAHSLAIINIGQYLSNFQTNFLGILEAFNINSIWFGLTAVFGLLYFFKSKDKKETKMFVFMLIILMLTPILFASFFNKFRLHYLSLSLGVFVIFLAKIFTSFRKFKILTLITVILLIKTITFDFKFLNFEKERFENQKFVNDISSAIIDEVSGPDSFQIKSYSMDEKILEYPTLATIFLIPLEDKLNKKLAVLDDNSPFNHHQIGGKQYFIVACHDFHFRERWDECLNTFTDKYPSYAILKNLYTGSRVSIYVTKHE